ncbi:MAG TPA: hypothetical protein VIM55_02105 [Mucilaginibacter sp.]
MKTIVKKLSNASSTVNGKLPGSKKEPQNDDPKNKQILLIWLLVVLSCYFIAVFFGEVVPAKPLTWSVSTYGISSLFATALLYLIRHYFPSAKNTPRK